MTKKTLVAAGALTVALAAGAVWAVGPGLRGLRAYAHGHGHGPFGHFGMFAVRQAIDELGLTEPQTAQIKAILRSHREEFRGIVERLHGVHDAVRQAAKEDAIDEAEVRERVGEAVGPLGDLAVLHARVHREIAAVLTPEQRRKAETLHEKLRQHRDEVHRHMREWADEFLEDPS